MLSCGLLISREISPKKHPSVKCQKSINPFFFQNIAWEACTKFLYFRYYFSSLQKLPSTVRVEFETKKNWTCLANKPTIEQAEQTYLHKIFTPSREPAAGIMFYRPYFTYLLFYYKRDQNCRTHRRKLFLKPNTQRTAKNKSFLLFPHEKYDLHANWKLLELHDSSFI